MKYVVVTGAGTGIGREMSIEAARLGYSVVLIGRRLQPLKETLSMLSGDGHQLFEADTRDLNRLHSIASELEDVQLHAVLANAGVGGENHVGENDRWNEIVYINLTGSYHTAIAFGSLLKKDASTPSHLIFTSSVLARLGVINYTAYCASKAGILGLMRSLAMEWAKDQVLVNAICPGWVNTEMSREGMEGIAKNIGVTTAEFHDIAMQSVPLGRMSEPQEIGQLIGYLISQKSITGQTIDINCGSIMNS